MSKNKGSKKSSLNNDDAIVIDSDHEQNQDTDYENNDIDVNDADHDGNHDDDGNDSQNDQEMGDDNNDNNDDAEEDDNGNHEQEQDGDENDNNNEENDGDDDGDEEQDDDNGSSNEKPRRRRKGSSALRSCMKRKRDNGYRIYLFKILQQVHPNTGITKTAMDIVNCFIQDMFERICQEAMKLTQYQKTNTISAREISTAAKLILPGELRKHAIEEGQKAVRHYEKHSKLLQKHRAEQRARDGNPTRSFGRKKGDN